MGPILLKILLSALDDGAEKHLRKVSDSTKLGGVVDIPDGCAAFQRLTQTYGSNSSEGP